MLGDDGVVVVVGRSGGVGRGGGRRNVGQVSYHGCGQSSGAVCRFGLAVRLVSRGTSVRIRFGSPFSSKVVVCGHCLVASSLTIMKH